jgi:predicted acylesterase/phospholipase RssA
MQQHNNTNMILPTIKHIVCSGGGHTGFTYYGILRETNKAGIWNIDNIESIYGTSVGSIFAVMLALKYDWDILDDYLIKRPWQNVYKIDMYSFIESLTKRGVFDIKVISDTFLPLFKGKDISLDITLKEFYEKTKIDLHIFATNLADVTVTDISHKTHPDWKVIDAVYCSSALPILFSPFVKDGTSFCDGGLLLNYPLESCISNGAKLDEIIAIRKDGILFKTAAVETNKTLIEYVLTLINSVFRKIQFTPHYELPNEIVVETSIMTLDLLISVVNSAEERQKLIDFGVELAKKYIASKTALIGHGIDELF